MSTQPSGRWACEAQPHLLVSLHLKADGRWWIGSIILIHLPANRLQSHADVSPMLGKPSSHRRSVLVQDRPMLTQARFDFFKPMGKISMHHDGVPQPDKDAHDLEIHGDGLFAG